MRRFLAPFSLVVLVATGLIIVQAQLPVNPQLTNGDFEAGNLSLGWITNGTQNFSVVRVESSGNHFAKLDVGGGPTGSASCTDPLLFNNFVALDQLFTLSRDQRIDLDFLVPLPGMLDSTEDAPCAGFDQVEIIFVLPDLPASFNPKLIGVILISFFPNGMPLGHLQVTDVVLNKTSFASFDPISFAPTTVGPLTIQASAALPGWLHASMEVSTSLFPWLPDQFTFRVAATLADVRFTGQDFSVSVDNVRAVPLSPPPPGGDFLLDITPLSRAINQGETTSFKITLTSVFGFSSPVTISVGGFPENTMVNVINNSVVPTTEGAISYVLLSTTTGGAGSPATPPGVYAISISAKSGERQHIEQVTLIVQ